MNIQELLDTEFTLRATHIVGFVFVLGLAVGFAGGLAIGNFETATFDANSKSQKDSQSNRDAPSTVDVSKIKTEEQPMLGQADAPVTMVIYEDFQCPFCKRFENGAIPRVVSNYVETGKVKLIWKDFPLRRIHPWAMNAATTMECVYRQDNQAFWEVKKKIFDNQESFNKSNVRERIIDYAENEGVSASRVRDCLKSGEPQESVKADMKEGRSFDAVVGRNSFVTGTPSVVIYGKGDERGEPLVGAQPYSAVKKVIKSKLN